MDIACSTFTVERRHRRGVVVLAPLAAWEDSARCPECGGELEAGHVTSTITFRADGESKPGYWRGCLNWWLRGIGARAEARRCRACAWIGMDCSTFVEPAPPVLFDRIEKH